MAASVFRSFPTRWAVSTAILCLVLAPPLGAQTDQSDVEERARLARRGAGLRVGVWDVRGMDEVSNATYAETPLFEGYFQNGLDRHLALQNSIGVWRRSQEIEQSGGPLGGSTTESVDTYVVPMFTALRFFPMTGPEQSLEPFVEGGAGISLGIDDRQGTSGGLLGVGGGEGIAMILGFGFKLGIGLEWRFSQPLGLTAGGRYQWMRYFQDVGGERIYRGFGAEVGLAYRFQYD